MSDKSKRIKDLTWDSVTLDGFPLSITEQGFVGLEECTNYDLDKNIKKTKIRKTPKKRKKPESKADDATTAPVKNIKLSNGFIVESCETASPSKTNISIESSGKSKIITEDTPKQQNKSKKAKLGEDIMKTNSSLTPEDMLSWAEFKLPEEITKALMELGFKQPTKIQQMALPAALHGRRDILGAAETGSGKTLAFGLPILTGIMKLKEKQQMGLDVYEVAYKKSSGRKKAIKEEPEVKPKGRPRKNSKKQQQNQSKVKESSEEGYSSGDEEQDKKTSENPSQESKEYDDDDYLEEIEVPLRKKVLHSDEEASDDENFIHLSDMLDADDLADKSSDEEDDKEKNDSGNEDAASTIEGEDTEMIDEDAEGIGCVKVIDDVQLPDQVVPKTGKPLYALILTPTRELAVQITNHLKAVSKYTGIRIATIVGGMAMVKQERQLAASPEIVVATPGRLWQLYNMGNTHLMQLPYVRFLAIDETDRMIEHNHFDELHPILERLNSDESKCGSRQNFVFSATLTIVHELPAHMRGKKVTKGGKIINRKVQKMTPQHKIKRLVEMIGMSEPKVVDITQENQGAAENLTESRIACSLEDKDVHLYYVLKRHPGRTIVFCNSINSVKRLAELLLILKCKPLPLYASMPQKQRLKNLERFRDSPHSVLVATDVAARGLDIPDVDHVIHYQVPRTAENYIHRSGRTARANKEGLTILMMEPDEAYTYSKLYRTLNRTTELPSFPLSPLSLPPLRRQVTLARELLHLQQMKNKANAAAGWREKMAREMDIIVDDDVLPVKKVDPSIIRAIDSKKRQLDSLLAQPVFPKGFSYKYPTLNDPMALSVPDENALEVMKKAIQSGEIKKQKRKSKNEAFLKLEKLLKNKN